MLSSVDRKRTPEGEGRRWKERQRIHTEGSPGAKLEGSGLRNRRRAERWGAGVETGGGLGAQNVAGLGPANTRGWGNAPLGTHLLTATGLLLVAESGSYWVRLYPRCGLCIRHRQ